jgi:hypothetical protein
VVTGDVERARAVFGRLLLIRSVGQLRAPEPFPDWTYLPVAGFFLRCAYREQVAVLSEGDRAVAREPHLETHLDPDNDPDLPFDEQATTRRYDDLNSDERDLGAGVRALPDDLPATAPTSQVLTDALHRTAVRMGGRRPGYSPYATIIHSQADRWPQWLAAELVRRAQERLPATGAVAVHRSEAAVSGTLHSLATP